ncbi:hypothetical protein [Paenibacillus antri]|uniref:hypothetical protein n=1 Tax=Paenibacillus antri TaxID=2582848 RepID=UPI0013917FF5|nr:hypothetical protein [Paenibacillus antri]
MWTFMFFSSFGHKSHDLIVIFETKTKWSAKKRMKSMTRFEHLARWLLGITFLIGACNGFMFVLGFPPILPTDPEIVALYRGSDALLALHKSIELGCAVLLLRNRLILPALIILAPVVLGIVAVHAAFDPGFLPAAGLIFALEAYLLYVYGARSKGGPEWKRNSSKQDGKTGIRNTDLS